MSDSQDTKPLLDLSDLRLTPKWVSDFGKSSSSSSPDQEETNSRPQRGGGRDFNDRRGGPRNDQRSGPGPRGPRDGGSQFRGGQGAGGGAGDRQRDGGNRSRDGRSPRPQDGRGRPGQGGDRRDFQDRRPPQEAPPRLPAGLITEIEPESRATEAMASMIRNAGKAYSVFDAARLVLSSGDRFHVKFSLPKDSEAKLYAIPADGSLWLSREEAIEHFLNSEGIKEFYRVEQVQLEAPKGNFASVAICGLSGTLLGPPSHHSYQTTLHRIHRERFANMSFEDYKRRVRTDNSPEAVEKWKESLTHGTEWVVITPGSEPEQEPVAEVKPPTEATPEVEAEAEAPISNAAPEVIADEPASEEAEAATPEASSEEAAPTPAPAAEPATPAVRLKTRAEMQTHFRENFAPTLVHETNTRYVSGNIPRQNINPGLYNLLRRSVDETRKHLLTLAQRLCIGFEQQGLKLFKRRGGKLWVSRARPRLLDSSVVLSERISLMMQIVKSKPGISAKALIEAVAPAAAKVETPTPEPTPAPAVVTESIDATLPVIDELGAVVESIVDTPTTVEEIAEAPAPVAAAVVAPHEPTADQMGALKDLHWLNSEGYVIEYADGQVFPGVTEPPPAKPKPEKLPVPVAPADEAAETEVPADSAPAEIAPIQAAIEMAPAPAPVEQPSADVESAEAETGEAPQAIAGSESNINELEASPQAFDFLMESSEAPAPAVTDSEETESSSAEPTEEAGFLVESEAEVEIEAEVEESSSEEKVAAKQAAE
ncbi:hypothetical protein FEM03_04290 [Phragmitibacter flavus]|uniref:Uncharacterized protein n=1 Tax=Phragmitibacter flavus TaxID=2576071 RepID=A0A5R8KI78_9BACT|nr:hypothetical protein [Phragmitibacter flavus]TLD71950.1 hypothetical protein FEM03_04290 [Phragmitibacter flavus]